jgi:hypothetical protein
LNIINYKKSFALFIVIVVLSFFSLYSYQILSNINFSNQLDKTKFDYIQALIYLDKLENQLKNDTNLSLNDERFSFELYQENNSTYHLFINSNNYVRIYKKIILP